MSLVTCRRNMLVLLNLCYFKGLVGVLGVVTDPRHTDPNLPPRVVPPSAPSLERLSFGPCTFIGAMPADRLAVLRQRPIWLTHYNGLHSHHARLPLTHEFIARLTQESLSGLQGATTLR